jgi:hypothetical protein
MRWRSSNMMDIRRMNERQRFLSPPKVVPRVVEHEVEPAHRGRHVVEAGLRRHAVPINRFR